MSKKELRKPNQADLSIRNDNINQGGEFGVKKPCFGEYKCTKCGRVWESSKAWRHFGQQCQTCKTTVNANHLEILFHYICKSCYLRSQGMEGHWKYKLCLEGRKCKTCKQIVKPFLTNSEYVAARKLYLPGEGPNHISVEKVHREDLCEKCRVLGSLCYGTGMATVSNNVDDAPLSSNSQPEKESKERRNCNYRSASHLKGTVNGKQNLQLQSSSSNSFLSRGGYTVPGISYRNVAAVGVSSTLELQCRDDSIPNVVPIGVAKKVQKHNSSSRELFLGPNENIQKSSSYGQINQRSRYDDGSGIFSPLHGENPSEIVFVLIIMACMFLFLMPLLSNNGVPKH